MFCILEHPVAHQRKQTRNAATQATLKKKMSNDFLMIFFDAIRECVHHALHSLLSLHGTFVFLLNEIFTSKLDALHCVARTRIFFSNVKQNTDEKIISNLRRKFSRNLCDCKLPLNRMELQHKHDIFLASYQLTAYFWFIRLAYESINIIIYFFVDNRGCRFSFTHIVVQ